MARTASFVIKGTQGGSLDDTKREQALELIKPYLYDPKDYSKASINPYEKDFLPINEFTN